MEAPAWVTPILSYLTALTLAVIMHVTVIKERRKHTKVARQPPPRRPSRTYLSYLVTVVMADLRRLLEVLWAAAGSTADLAGRVGVIVVMLVALIYAVTLPASVPDWEWLWGIPVGIVGVGGVYAVTLAFAKDPADD